MAPSEVDSGGHAPDDDSLRHHLTPALLKWGSASRRDLPWRRTRDPWRVLVSEVMLQQTQVDRVIPRYEALLDRWPTPEAYANATLREVLAEWAGLGYPRRARNLHLAAQRIVAEHDGVPPATLEELLALPGVGPYTARAVLVFAHEEPVGVVDTNVGRLLARWAGCSLSPREAQTMADRMVPADHAWEWTQAMFDLGASICTKRSPGCDRCPVNAYCAWARQGCPKPDPAVGSAGSSRTQARFEGSDRQARGRLLRALADGPVPDEQIAAVMGVDVDRSIRLLDALVLDGLVSRSGDGGSVVLGDG